MVRKTRSPKSVKPEKVRRMLARADSMEADFHELKRLVPQVQQALDNDSLPASVKREEVDKLSEVVGRIRTFSALLSPLQSNQLQLVQNKIQRFRQSIKRGDKETPSHASCVDLSTSLAPLGFEAEYNPAVLVLNNPPQQPAAEEGETLNNPNQRPEPDNGINRSKDTVNNPESCASNQNPLVSTSSRPHTRSQARDNAQEAAVVTLSLPSESNQMMSLVNTGTRPKTHGVVAHRQEQQISQAQQSVTTSTQVTRPHFEYSLGLDPGDPVNASPVPALQPVHDSSSGLIGFTAPARSCPESEPQRINRDEPSLGQEQGKRSTKKGPKAKFANSILGKPQPVKEVAFSIYHDPPSNPDTSLHTVYNQPISYPYRSSQRIPLAPVKPDLATHAKESTDSSGLSEPAAHSTPLANFAQELPPSDPPNMAGPSRPLLGPKDSASAKTRYYQDRLREIREYHNRAEQTSTIDPLAMDDPAFPDQWRMPPGPVLQRLYRSQELGKMWKYADQIATFEGGIQQYVRWAPTFYDMVHIQPMPWAYKINVLATKLAPKISSFIIGSLAFEKRDYVTALCRLEKYFGGEERIAQAQLATLEEFPKIQRDDWLTFRKFLDTLETYLRSGPFDPHPVSRQNVMIMTMVKRRLPALWYQKFVTWCLEGNHSNIPANFIKWAGNRVDPHLLDVQFSSGKPKKLTVFEANSPGEPDLEGLDVCTLNLNTPELCPKCGVGHSLKKCEQFYLMNYKERRAFVVSTGRCLCCLGAGHRWEQCYSKARCGICAEKHHLLVHNPDIPEEDSKPTFFGYCTSNILRSYNYESTQSRKQNPQRVDSRAHL